MFHAKAQSSAGAKPASLLYYCLSLCVKYLFHYSLISNNEML